MKKTVRTIELTWEERTTVSIEDETHTEVVFEVYSDPTADGVGGPSETPEGIEVVVASRIDKDRGWD